MGYKDQESKVNYMVCAKCGHVIEYCNSDTWWDYSGSGYDTKLVKCTECNTPMVVEYEYDDWFVNGF
jgi:hypothetical protein